MNVGHLYDLKGKVEKLDTKGSIWMQDALSLASLITSVQCENPLIVEVGSWKGGSTALLANEVKHRGGKVFAVDHWKGSEGIWDFEVAQKKDIYSLFRHNIISLGLWDIVCPLVTDSQTAARIFADEILDLVFIDSCHSYENVKQDIKMWLPKLKKGGILCGHDAEGYYSEYDEEDQKLIDEHLDIDYIELTLADAHPGVIKALYDCFEDKHTLMPNRIWSHIKV